MYATPLKTSFSQNNVESFDWRMEYQRITRTISIAKPLPPPNFPLSAFPHPTI